MLSATSDSVAAKDKMFATRVTAVFERAVFDSDLGSMDKRDMALAYLDYLQECAASVTQIKTVKSRLSRARARLRDVLEALDIDAYAAGGNGKEVS